MKDGNFDKELQKTTSKAEWDSTKEVKVTDKAFLTFRERIAADPDQVKPIDNIDGNNSPVRNYADTFKLNWLNQLNSRKQEIECYGAS